MVWHVRKLNYSSHTLLNVTIFPRVNKQNEFLNFTELWANYVCAEMGVDSELEAPLSRKKGKESQLLESDFFPSTSSAAHILGWCSSSEVSDGLTASLCFHKKHHSHTGLAKGCLIKTEYPLRRPRPASTQGRLCEAHNAFIVEGNVWTPTRHYVHAHPHTHAHTHAHIHTHNHNHNQRNRVK